MLFKKQQIMRIIISIGLSIGVISITPINVFAKSMDFVTNNEAEDSDKIQDGSLGEAPDEGTEESPDEVPDEGVEGNPDETPDEGVEGNPDEAPDEGTEESPDEVPDEGVEGNPDEVPDEGVEGNPDEAPDEGVEGNPDEGNEGNPDEVPDGDVEGNPDEILDKDITGEIGDELPIEDINIISDKDAKKSTEKQTSGLSVSVEYPEQIQCKTPITFTVNADGGSGDYQYRIHSILVYDGSEYVSVYDVSYGSNSAFQDSNTFSFTFHASGTYYLRFSVRDKITGEFKNTGFDEYILNIQDPQYPSVEQIVENTVAECMQSCTTDFEKALWLHDWILDHADYDYSYSYCSAEGVLARGEGTCEAYHRAYVMLLNKAGIATGRVTGNGHVWTAVRMDGEWYQVDSTWDDMGEQYKGSYYEHMYFGLTDYIIGLVHSEHTSVAGYESTSLENNYFIKTGMITRWSDPFVELVNENIASGNTEFSLPVTDSMPDDFKNVIYNLVAYQLSNQKWGNIEISAVYKDNAITFKTGAGLGELSSLSITPPTKVSYEKGEAIDTAGLIVTANYINGSRILNNDEYRIEGFDTSTVGTQTATITFGGKSAAFQYTVQEKQELNNVYNGIDYSEVYDYSYYLGKYPDLKKAFNNNEKAALQHFVTHGMSEGRQGKDSFNVEAYMNRYADLKKAFGNDLKRYYLHYINVGMKEGRDGSGESGGSNPVPPTGSTTIYNGVDYASVYDYSYYLGKHPDLKKAFNSNEKAALQHFVTHGMSEGRQGKDSFNVEAYMNRYADLKKAFGNDLKRYYLHYINVGMKEGRDGSGESGGSNPVPPTGSTTIYNGVDYASVYDYSYYLGKHPDLKKAFNSNEKAALQHFVTHGMSEGRQGKDSFNVHIYKNRYADLRNAFGNNLKDYYLHYMNNGLKEGRSGR